MYIDDSTFDIFFMLRQEDIPCLLAIIFFVSFTDSITCLFFGKKFVNKLIHDDKDIGFISFHGKIFRQILIRCFRDIFHLLFRGLRYVHQASQQLIHLPISDIRILYPRSDILIEDFLEQDGKYIIPFFSEGLQPCGFLCGNGLFLFFLLQMTYFLVRFQYLLCILFGICYPFHPELVDYPTQLFRLEMIRDQLIPYR